ncbi:FlgK family flagellar hook-associated protein [Wigglesworthia glossinidia endosymbiont of Glossina morsitans morsitans (Yale colony)]|uniref:Flagellar hook-associated protein 1 n=1 Tax=Wigglesworthia glossinidia endosymbiont of Glossina morsitans morsitans (Yale colony) TaxID=1142511 RepID=H6Q5K7_WIGGL|nr:flagellar hook-associated protein FlgK [Wigglesworthia glossinidia]AFA40911.1 FlgK family flagellar hook-associated protein [Wigglesworthia glossinidia endosymbiont of Glossina morsitans morsitans (Yale colony)]
MFNLYHIAGNSLKYGELALSVAENNISNANNTQYHREQLINTAMEGKNVAKGFIGNGIEITNISRIYDEASNEKIRHTNSALYALYAKSNKLKNLDNFFSNNIENFSKQLDNVFSSLESIAQQPDNNIYRTNIVLEFESLVNQFNNIGNQLNKIQSNTSEEIYSVINTINNLSSELKNINYLIANSNHNQVSLNLLDKRDSLLEELSKKIGIIVHLNEKGSTHITLENGFTLLDNTQSYPLIYEKDNNQNIIISYLNDAKTQKEKVQINFNTISSGEIGGLISFYNYNIPILKEKINQNIFYLSQEFNKINREGYDLNRNKGKDIFSYQQLNSVQSKFNTGNAKISNLDIKDSNISALRYNLLYQSDHWVIFKLVNGKETKVNYETDQKNLKNEILFDNISVHLDGIPNNGDQFQISSLMNISDSIKLNLNDGNLLSASDNNLSYNNNVNALKLLEIQNIKLFNNSTFTENYADFMSYIGQITKKIQNVKDSQEKINNQLHLEHENKIGINLQEEYIYIELYRQYYYANIQLIKIASSLFESLLGIVSK